MTGASEDTPELIDDSALDDATGGGDAKRDHDYVGNYNFKVEINGVSEATVTSWDYAKKETVEGKTK